MPFSSYTLIEHEELKALENMVTDIKSLFKVVSSSINWWPHLVFLLLLFLVYLEFNVAVLIPFSQIFFIVTVLMVFANASIAHQYFKEYVFLYDIAWALMICAGFNLANVLYHFQVFSYSYTGLDVRFVEVLSFLVFYYFFEKKTRSTLFLTLISLFIPVMGLLILNDWLWHFPSLNITVLVNLVLCVFLIVMLLQRQAPIALRTTIYFILAFTNLSISLMCMLLTTHNLWVYFFANLSDWFILSGFVHNSLQLELSKVKQERQQFDLDKILTLEMLSEIKHDGINLELQKVLKEQQNLQNIIRNYSYLINQPFMGVYVSTASKFVYYNPKFADIVGLDISELMNKTLLDIAGDTDENKQLISQISEEVQNSDEGVSFKFSFVRKDGNRVTVGLHGIPILWSNHPAVFALVEDLTDSELNKQKVKSYILQQKAIYKGTLIAISNMVEKRDPYTAGHQRRVGKIAKQIAKEMGLDDEKCETIELIGLVHDIGKISIPAEILAKPTKLSDFEMGLIKEHPQYGYDILKHVDFAFPVAEVILQHHERLDGSGYPRQLSGDQILLETRIISVADVLEAISSFRPYRPALGLEAAVEEIQKGRGILFDADVVDSLLKLVKDKRLVMQ